VTTDMLHAKDVLELFKDSLCIRCKHFNVDRFMKDLRKGKLLTDACRKNVPLSTITVRIICSSFEPIDGSDKVGREVI